MEAIAALGLASNIIQIVDFSSRIISRGQEIYSSSDGSTAEHALLSDVARNLAELHQSLIVSGSVRDKGKRKLTVADKQLLDLKIESQKIVKDLQEALNKIKLSKKDRKWRSVRHALLSIQSDKEIANLAARLDSIRKQVDSAAMISIL
jgi:pyruvate-formate lyase-activating enzyme